MVAIFNKPSAEDVQPLPQEMAQALDSAGRWILNAVQSNRGNVMTRICKILVRLYKFL